MAILHCRKCQADISSESTSCPKCKCNNPFACAVCSEPCGNLQPIGGSYPFDQNNQPLCPKHARLICDRCGKPFQQDTITTKVVKWEAFETGDYIPINGAFCASCVEHHIEPEKPTSRPKRRGCLGVFCFLAIPFTLGVLLLLLR